MGRRFASPKQKQVPTVASCLCDNDENVDNDDNRYALPQSIDPDGTGMTASGALCSPRQR
ncbi:MAG: hypothetical protein K2L45_08105 [Muribaculaceae bacterium]|nr:hypothetical protein [Muribaculaceae bacterium]